LSVGSRRYRELHTYERKPESHFSTPTASLAQSKA
jgi:hypothetical protein